MSGPPSFAADIVPLWREDDVESMLFAFDLRSYDDVRENAEDIWDRLDDGSMPCDEEWPADRVALFRSWIDAGLAP
ncbi:MAG TPA: hypothetical protein VHK22_01820 [Gaiellaceae bacterium]|jgi:hypothetical protein|nr:hypothetical protein [Gaiellaceae bacterium]